MQGEPGPKGDAGPYGLKGAKVGYKKKKKRFVLAKISSSLWVVCNETPCAYHFREIQEETANREDLEIMAHWDLR